MSDFSHPVESWEELYITVLENAPRSNWDLGSNGRFYVSPDVSREYDDQCVQWFDTFGTLRHFVIEQPYGAESREYKDCPLDDEEKYFYLHRNPQLYRFGKQWITSEYYCRAGTIDTWRQSYYHLGTPGNISANYYTYRGDMATYNDEHLGAGRDWYFVQNYESGSFPDPIGYTIRDEHGNAYSPESLRHEEAKAFGNYLMVPPRNVHDELLHIYSSPSAPEVVGMFRYEQVMSIEINIDAAEDMEDETIDVSVAAAGRTQYIPSEFFASPPSKIDGQIFTVWQDRPIEEFEVTVEESSAGDYKKTFTADDVDFEQLEEGETLEFNIELKDSEYREEHGEDYITLQSAEKVNRTGEMPEEDVAPRESPYVGGTYLNVSPIHVDGDYVYCYDSDVTGGTIVKHEIGSSVNWEIMGRIDGGIRPDFRYHTINDSDGLYCYRDLRIHYLYIGDDGVFATSAVMDENNASNPGSYLRGRWGASYNDMDDVYANWDGKLVRFKEYPFGKITGRVEKEDGTPVEGVTVEAEPVNYDDVLADYTVTETDENGEFTFKLPANVEYEIYPDMGFSCRLPPEWGELTSTVNVSEGINPTHEILTVPAPERPSVFIETAKDLWNMRYCPSPSCDDIPEWEEGENYEESDVVCYDGEEYQCIANHVSLFANEPTEGRNWQDYWVEFYYRLENDIDLTGFTQPHYHPDGELTFKSEDELNGFLPITDYWNGERVNCRLEGNGYTIKGIDMYFTYEYKGEHGSPEEGYDAALFDSLDGRALVRELKISDCSFRATDHMGEKGDAAAIAWESRAKIENVLIEDTLITGKRAAGVFVKGSPVWYWVPEIYNCGCRAVILGETCGGIVHDYIQIYDSYFAGYIEGEQLEVAPIAKIDGEVIIENCYYDIQRIGPPESEVIGINEDALPATTKQLVPHLEKDPSTHRVELIEHDTGSKPFEGGSWQRFWEIENKWEEGAEYEEEDVAYHAGQFYICTVEHKATEAKAPPSDYWLEIELNAEAIGWQGYDIENGTGSPEDYEYEKGYLLQYQGQEILKCKIRHFAYHEGVYAGWGL